MKKKPIKVYVETSVWNFLFADDALEKMEATEKFFDAAADGAYELFISDVVIQEINRAPENKGKLLFGAIEKHQPTLLERDEQALSLATEYLNMGTLKEKQYLDLLHLAIASANEMAIIVSWNMKHIVKRKTSRFVNAGNKIAGYRDLEIWTPEELIDYED